MGTLGRKYGAKSSIERVVLVACAVFISGCTSSAGPVDRPPESGSTIVVDDGEGWQVAVNVTNETGAVVGQVLTDAGFGLPDALVVVTGADSSVRTNKTGWFEVLRVSPGKRIVRAEHVSYRPAESEVSVVAGKVTRLTITLVPPIDGEAWYRPHVHDYWAGRASVDVIDRDVEFWRTTMNPPYSHAYLANQKVGQLAGYECVNQQGQSAGSSFSMLTFDDPTQIVWPGTQTIEVSLSWQATDFVGSDRIGIAWKSASGTKFNLSPPLKNNEVLRIKVEPGEHDPAHHMFSLWEFRVCIGGKGEATTAGRVVGRAFLGKYHAKMTLFAGASILADPPHPRFWANGSTLKVLDDLRTATCPDVDDCITTTYSGRDSREKFWFHPSSLVPPGTGKIKATLSWNYAMPVNNKPLSLTYSPANQPPLDKYDHMKFKKPAPAAKGTNWTSYEFAIQPGENDAFYQAKTNWRFLWGYEGEEYEDLYVHSCGCEIRVRLVVDVMRDS